MINFYKTLGVEDFASAEEIKTAYRKLSKKFHPDVNEGDPFFEERFKELQSAYETLSNRYRRRKYDRELKQDQLFKSELNQERVGNCKHTDSTGKDFSFANPINIFIIVIAVVAFIILFRFSKASQPGKANPTTHNYSIRTTLWNTKT
jgi:DnaJ-class molecular chaperone